MGGANANEVISALVHGRDDKRALQSQKLFQGGVKASRVQGEVREGDRGWGGVVTKLLEHAGGMYVAGSGDTWPGLETG